MNKPRFSLVIPAYNEANWLPALLDSVEIACSRYPDGIDRIEIVVADNASTDATSAIATARGCRVVTVEKRLIAAARNGGAAMAQGEVLCFIDADSRIHPDTFNAIERVLSRDNVIVGATGVNPDRWSAGIFCTWLIAVPMTYLMRVDAGVVFCRRQDFLAVGGYNEDLAFAEDIRLLADLKQLGRTRGQQFERARNAKAITSSRKFDKHGDWHLLTMPLRVGFWLLFNKKRMQRETRNYWYEDR